MAGLLGSCSDGGDYYVCQGNVTQFIGCCSSDPCADGTGYCPSSDIRYTSFDAADYDRITTQACAPGGGYGDPKWYTCRDNTPPFMGCCLTDACGTEGCSGSNITAAVLSSNTALAAPFMTPTATAAATPAKSSGSSLSKGAIAGIAVAVVIVAMILAVVLFKVYQRQKKKRLQDSTTVLQPNHQGAPQPPMHSPYHDSNGFPSPPPQYAGASGGFGSEGKFSGYPHSPGQVHHEQFRPVSVAPSWLSDNTTNDQGYGHHNYASVSSLGTNGSQGGLHHLYNQQRPQQQLNTVSEMDATPVARPVSELPGRSSLDQQGNHYETGYTTISTGEESPRRS